MLDDFGRIRLATLSFTFVCANTSEKQEKNPSNSQAKNSTVNTIKVGSFVRPTGRRYVNGLTMPDWVRSRTFKITQIRGREVQIKSDSIQNWVFIDEITLV
jgi:hypothetical protein